MVHLFKLAVLVADVVATATAQVSMAPQGAYTLFDAEISSASPPSDLFPFEGGLSRFARPRFLVPGTISSKPIPTNRWWGNLIAASTGSYVAPVWTNPYSLRPNLGAAPFGLSVNFPYATRSFGGSTDNGGSTTNRYYTHWYVDDVVMSATEFATAPALLVPAWDDLSVTVSLRKSSRAKIDATLVPGMAFVTSKYLGLTPKLTTTSAIVAIDGLGTQAGSTVTGRSFKLVFANGQSWLLVASSPISFALTDSNNLVASGIFNGVLRIALYTTAQQLRALTSTAGCLLEGSNVEARDERSYMFHLKTSGTCRSGLFHYLQAHHMATLDRTSAGAVSSAFIESATRGRMTGVLTKTTPPVIRFVESANVKAEFYPPRAAVGDVAAINSTLESELNAEWSLPTDETYYFNGKAAHKYANLCLVANDATITGAYKTSVVDKCLKKLRAVLVPFIANSFKYRLSFDTTYRGIISPSGIVLNTVEGDFGNTIYSDHAYHYGYWIATAAIVNYLDPSWDRLAQLNRVTSHLVRDVANPSTKDPYFPKFRSFDWFRGHSLSHGVTPFHDGKDLGSSSEDINVHYAIAVYGKVTGNVALQSIGLLLLRVNTRAVQTYVLMTSDNVVHPPSIVPNKVTGVYFDNKADYTTWFTSQKDAIHGIQMMPITPVTEYVRTTKFVQEEWDSILSKIPDVVAVNPDNAWLSLLFTNYATLNSAAAIPKIKSVKLDNGLSRTWALYIAATRKP